MLLFMEIPVRLRNPASVNAKLAAEGHKNANKRRGKNIHYAGFISSL